MGRGGDHFCQPHICRSSISAESSASWLFTSQGRGRESFLAISIISIIVVASFIAGLPFGPAGVAISYSASCLLIQLPILYYLVGRSGPVRAGDLWIGFLRQLAFVGCRVFGYLVGASSDTGRPATQGIIDCDSVWSARWSRLYFRLLPGAPGGHEPVFHLAWVEESSMKPLVSILSGANASSQTCGTDWRHV